MSKLALLVKALPILTTIGDKIASWLRKDPKTFKAKLAFLVIISITLIVLTAWLGEPSVNAGVDAVIKLCDEVGC